MKNNIHFSIIIPTYNRAYCLWKAISSIVSQTYPFFEIIIIDDASTDDTEKLIKEFSDPRIKYFRNKKNLGTSESRNIGLSLSRDDFIAYLDSDNTWYPDFLEVYKNSIEAYPDKKVFYAKKNYRLHIIDKNNEIKTVRDENSNTENYFDLKRLYQRKIIIDTNVLVHEKEIVEKIGGWDKNLNFWEDWELTLRIAKENGNIFQPINRVLLNYEQTLNFQDRELAIKKWECAEEYIFNKYKNHPLLEEQEWYSASKAKKSTLSIIEFLMKKKGA